MTVGEEDGEILSEIAKHTDLRHAKQVGNDGDLSIVTTIYSPDLAKCYWHLRHELVESFADGPCRITIVFTNE